MRFIFALIMSLPALSSAETLIVKFKNSSNKSNFVITTKQAAKAQVMGGKILIVDGDYASFQKSLDVEYVERNQTFHALGFKSVTPDAKAWGVVQIQAAQMWAKGIKGAGIKVAVIDTGVDGTHPELAGKVLPGYNAIDGSSNAMDDMGHGTHCSGTIAGNTTGVAPDAKIVPVKFLDASGSGTTEGAIKAIDWATKQDVQVMSNSWGGGGFSQALEDVVKEAEKKGIWFIAAAGNETNDNDADPTYPAGFKVDNVVAVAATDKNDKLASFSNWGEKSVLVAAPGVAIYSSLPGGKYDSWSGTSMATPHVSGASALLLQSGCKDLPTCLGQNYKKVSGLSKKTKLGGRLELK